MCIRAILLLIVAATTFIIIDITDSAEAEDTEIEWLSAALPGLPTDIEIRGDIAYLTVTSGLLAVDVSEPGSPELLDFHGLPGYTEGLAVEEDRVFVANGESGIFVFDSSDPSDLQILSHTEMAGYAWDVTIRGSTLFTSNGALGMAIYNLTSNDSLELISATNLPGDARKTEVEGTRGYVAGFDGGLILLNITDLENPVQMDRYTISGEDFNDVGLMDDYAIVTSNYEGRVHVIDASAPDELTLISTIETPGYSVALDIVGELAFIADHHKGFRIYNLSNPAEPQLVTNYYTEKYALGIEVENDYAHVIHTSGARVFNVTNTSQPEPVGDYSEFGSATYKVAVWDNYLLTHGGQRGFWVIDIAIPSAPLPLSFTATGDDGNGGVFVSDGLAFIADGKAGLLIYDLADPADPQFAGSLDTWGNTMDVIVREGIAYVADDHGGLLLVDVTNHSHPQLAGSVGVTGNSVGLALSPPYVFVASGQGGLHIVDVSDVTAPSEVGSVSFGNNDINDVAVFEDYAFVAAGEAGLKVVDVSQPELPAVVSSLSIDGEANAVLWREGYLFLAARTGLFVINVSDPLEPVIEEWYDTPGSASDVILQEELVIIADRWTQIHLLRVTGLNRSPVVESLVLSTEVLEEGNDLQATAAATDLDGEVVQYEWFSNGIIAGSGNHAIFQKLTVGEHVFCVRAQDDSGFWSGQECVTVAVADVLPVARMETTAEAVRVGESITLSGSGSDALGNITGFEWRSDRDGILGGSASLTVDNLSLGNHVIALRVRDDEESWSEPLLHALRVYAVPTVEILVPDNATAGQPLNFSVTASDEDGRITSVAWDFDGDGFADLTTEEGGNVTHTYAAAGNHTVTVTVTDDDGHVATATAVVEVAAAEVLLPAPPAAEPGPPWGWLGAAALLLALALIAWGSSRPSASIAALRGRGASTAGSTKSISRPRW